MATARAVAFGWVGASFSSAPSQQLRKQTAMRGAHLASALAAAAAGGASAPLASSTSRDVSCLTLEELQQTLSQRRLKPDGSREDLEQRLADFMAHPEAYPDADCRPAAETVWLVGGRLFGSMQLLRRHIQLLLELLPGDLVEPGHSDFDFLLALLRMHPRYAEKVSHPPVARFQVQTVFEHDQQPIRYFEYQDARGSWEDFSYRKCIGFTPEHNSALTVRDAMRWAVGEQLEAYRRACTGTTAQGRPVHRCSECGRRVQDGRKLRLEHVEPTFNQLIKDFTTAAGREPPPVDGKVPGSNRGCFTDEEWVASWRRYHRKHVRTLQLLCIPCAKERRSISMTWTAPQSE